MYILAVLVFVSNLIIIIKDTAFTVNLDDLSWALALCLITLVAIIALLIGYHLFKSYLFFAKKIFFQSKQSNKCTFKRCVILFWHVILITLLILYSVLLFAEFTMYIFKTEYYDLTYTTSLRKVFMFLLLHLNALTILLLYYYVALNQKKK